MKMAVNVVICASLLLIVYFSYAFMSRTTPGSPHDVAQTKSLKLIQLDVLNGCRINGAAGKVTKSLRASGFDVVEMKNYKMSNVHQTIVVDRVGDLTNARRVAQALGVSEKNVVQQINPDYFVDVSVIIGDDFTTLHFIKE